MRGVIFAMAMVVLMLAAWYPAPADAQCVGGSCPVLTAPLADAGEYVAVAQPVRASLRAVAVTMKAIVERRPVRRIGRAVFRPVRRVACRLRLR
jgi:hypothetical protein